MKRITSLKIIIKTDPGLNAIYKKHIGTLEYLDNFRDHLEHITDGRTDGVGKKGVPLKTPGMLGNLFGDEYDFGGEKFKISKAFLDIEEMHNQVNEWNKNVRL